MITETVCRVCSHWKISPRYQCPPVFLCRERGGIEWKRVHGRSASEAVETFSERQPHFFLSPREYLVEVKSERAGDDEMQVFQVGPICKVDYVAREI
ncbi:MAG TPA: hypothetical protein VE954_27060 [Oligoflexus sp.]|uniref:hypothetical protein n=1 Tax=Oligoflexus sp. TaxID=1971216 RepID=UPI002D4F6E04|nr:hypothetical protein [Oligoflexus sp.]HYX36784.1 hypothetical protein [Oligoflexus sp.]